MRAFTIRRDAAAGGLAESWPNSEKTFFGWEHDFQVCHASSDAQRTFAVSPRITILP
jgi:hypothetical protein